MAALSTQIPVNRFSDASLALARGVKVFFFDVDAFDDAVCGF